MTSPTASSNRWISPGHEESSGPRGSRTDASPTIKRRLPILFGDYPIGQGDLGGGSSQYYLLGHGVREHAHDVGCRADLVNDLLEALRAFGVGEEEDTHNIVSGTGWAVFMRGRGPVRALARSPRVVVAAAVVAGALALAGVLSQAGAFGSTSAGNGAGVNGPAAPGGGGGTSGGGTSGGGIPGY